MPNLVIKSRNSTHAQAAAGVDSPPGGFVNYREQVGESFRGGQGADPVHLHVAETSGRNRDVLGPHVDVPEYLTLLAGQQALVMAATSAVARFQTNLARMRRLEAAYLGGRCCGWSQKPVVGKIEGLLA